MPLPEHLWGPPLALALRGWRDHVFAPALRAKAEGRYDPRTLGNALAPDQTRGRGPALSYRYAEPQLMARRPEHYDLVSEFDAVSDEYEAAVRPFSDPIVAEAKTLLRPHLRRGMRVLDPSAGPASTAIEYALERPDCEFVCADLSEGMVRSGFTAARRARCRNMAFFQADVSHPPPQFEGYFDVVLCVLSFHHYPDGRGAARAFRRVLRPGGIALVVDAGPEWFITIARGLSVLTDPGFVEHRSGEQFRAVFLQAGFREFHWVEALPGMGFSMARA